MLTRDVVESLGDDERIEVAHALSTLWASGVCEMQIATLEREVLDGDLNESMQSLTDRILRFREQRSQLQELHELGHEYNKEQTNVEL